MKPLAADISDGRFASDSKFRPELSLVIPVYNEEESISELVSRVAQVMRELGLTYEVLIVDDGSTDSTAHIIAQHATQDSHVRGVYLARNYGQSTALQAGFDAAEADIIITLDGDLQNDPADIPMMLDLLEQESVDLVCGWRANRQDPVLRTAVSQFANQIIGRLTRVRLHDYGCSLKVYRRKILDRTRLYGEMHRFLPALIAEVGGRSIEVKVQHHPRLRGKSKYSLDRTIRVFLDMLLLLFFRKYLQRPLHLFGGAGLVLSSAGLLMLTYLVSLKLVLGESIGDRPLLLLGIMCFLLGMMLIGQGLLGEIVSRIYFASGRQSQYHLADGPRDCEDHNDRAQSAQSRL
jgi:glycosyltransferase involved in cell wall biosynthesis